MGEHLSDKEVHAQEGFLFLPEGMDAFSYVLASIIVLSVVAQIIYMISPRIFKVKMIDLDWHHERKGSISLFSYSGLIAIFFCLLTLLFGVQAYFYTSKLKSYETLET